jgi:hypothetical protein
MILQNRYFFAGMFGARPGFSGMSSLKAFKARRVTRARGWVIKQNGPDIRPGHFNNLYNALLRSREVSVDTHRSDLFVGWILNRKCKCSASVISFNETERYRTLLIHAGNPVEPHFSF